MVSRPLVKAFFLRTKVAPGKRLAKAGIATQAPEEQSTVARRRQPRVGASHSISSPEPCPACCEQSFSRRFVPAGKCKHGGL